MVSLGRSVQGSYLISVMVRARHRNNYFTYINS